VTGILRDLPWAWRRTSTRGALVLAAILGAAAGSLPLLEVPGYELSEAAALLAALALGPWLGIAAARRELARGEPSPIAAWASSSATAVLLLAGLFAGSALRAAFGPCPPLQEAAFFPALAVPSALLGCALGSALGLASRGRRAVAGLLYAGVVLLALTWRLLALYRGPEAYLLDPLLGYFPGPLYDEAVPLDGRLLAARTGALGWAAAVAGGAALARWWTRRRDGGARALRGPGALTAAGLALVAAGWCARVALQGGADLRGAIADRLGGRRDGPRCTLFLASEKPAAAADELLAECEFHAADVAAILGIPSPPHVTVYLYRSVEEKRQLIGASHTDFTRPWRAEIHLLDQPLPHPVLRHEIVHAVASALAPGPFHVPARLRVLPDLTLVEGLAVALESHRSGFTLSQWSRAARDLGYLPDLGRTLGPAGFWSQAPARAYTAAGSFLAFLLRRHGPAAVGAAYRTGDLATALGEPLPALVREWQRSLDEVAPEEDLTVAAARWFGRGSIFERRCAREAAALLRRAGAEAALGRTAQACHLYDREARIDRAPDALELSANVLAQSGQLDAAEAALREAAARIPPEDLGQRAELRAEEGDLRWRRGDAAGAIRDWSDAGRYPFQRAQARLLEVKALAAADPALGPAVRSLLLDPRDPGGLVEVARSRHPLAGYLAGRWLLQQGARALAAPELARAAAAGLPRLVELEARLSLAEASCDPAYDALLTPLAAAAPADRDRLDEARRRCAFEARIPR
jgi:tetratricopeptide (TPR) repeat protein